MKRESFDVSRGALRFLGEKTAATFGVLSPFASLPLMSSNEEEISALKKAGLIDDRDNLTPKAMYAMQILADPAAVFRCRFTSGLGRMEDTFYFAPGQKEVIRLKSREEGWRISYPVKVGEVLQTLRALWGDSPFLSLNVETDLSLSGALAYAAGIDIMRRRMLAALGLGTSYDIALTGEHIIDEVKSAKDDAQWLTTVVYGIINRKLTDDEIRQGLKELTDRGLLIVSGEQFNAGPEMVEVASRLLLIESLLSVRAAYKEKGEVRQLGYVAVMGGIHDVLMLEPVGDKLSFTGIAPETVLEYVEVLFNRLLLLGDANTSKAEDALLSRKCSVCLSEIPAHARFCPVCGEKTGKEIRCPRCDNPAPAGAKFCVVCGSRI